MGALTFGALIVIAAPVCAQNPLPAGRLHRVTAPVRDAGILHVATGTWTRKASAASLGADTVYDNTFATPYYWSLSGAAIGDEGRLPSPTSPTNFTSRPGCATSYTIDGFQIAYCTDRLNPAPFELAFYESYVWCSSVTGVIPTAVFLLSGLPGSRVGTVSACWTVTIDLDAPAGVPSSAFRMVADGDGSFSPPAYTNVFGWSFRSTAPSSEQLATGPRFAGDPNASLYYDGTRWDSPVNYLESGTGMGNMNTVRIDGGPLSAGCYDFQGFPFAGLHLELYADACPPLQVGTEFCVGDGSATPCPCGNSSLPADRAGCRNSLGLAGALRAEGTPSLVADTVRLMSSAVPANAPQLFFQGIVQQNGGLGTVYGDGLRCAGGTVLRIGVRSSDANGFADYPSAGDASVSARGLILSPGIRTYQSWYRNAANFCTSATFNLTNGLEIAWLL